MNGISKKGISLLVILCLLVMTMVGCGKTDTETADNSGSVATTDEATGDVADDTKEEATIDTSKRVDLVFYLMGDAPKDMQAVQDAINEKLLEKINATVTFNFTSWTDWQTKYNMVLSSGEQCDLIYTANWINYATLCKNDAFTALDELLPTYAPELWATIKEDVWNQMKVDDQIFAVPSTRGEYTNSGIMYREDLREKYSLPVPDSMENIEAYLTGIKTNEPNQEILKPSVNSAAFHYSFSADLVLQAKYGWVSPGAPYGLAANYNTPSELFNYWASDDFRADMKVMKTWADKGFWSKSVLSEANVADAFTNGQEVLVIDGLNPAKYMGTLSAIEKDHPDWKVGFIPYAKLNGVAYANHATGNGTAIPSTSSNPERAAMALNLLYADKEINQLIQYGIQGTHYTVDDKGYYVAGEKNADFGSESANTWNLRNPEFSLSQEKDEQLNAIFTELHDIAMKTNYPDVDIASGFIEVVDEYAAERAALSTVMVQYLAPIQAGLVTDVDAAIDEFLEKAEQAGLSKIQEAYSVQWKAYCDEKGYK